MTESQAPIDENLIAIENVFSISASKPEEQPLIFGLIDKNGKKNLNAAKKEFI